MLPTPPTDAAAELPFPATPRDPNGDDLIRVKIFPHDGLEQSENARRIAFKGACTVFTGLENEARATGVAQQTATTHEFSAATLEDPVWLACDEPVVLLRGGKLPRHHYSGDFYVYRSKRKSGWVLQVINIVPIETYLRGVLPVEVIPSWPEESLKAQAVAARTYAYYNIAHSRMAAGTVLYDVDDTPLFQVYNGLTDVTPETDQAVRATREVVMTVHDRIIQTFFHADSGGHTESARAIFGLTVPYCRAKKEPYDLSGAVERWSKTIRLKSVTAQLQAAKLIPRGRNVVALRVNSTDRMSSGRVRTVWALLEGGGSARIGSSNFKRAVGGLRSSLWDLKLVGPGRYRLDGRGSGHGVGLSQRGAKELASQLGWDHLQILTHYYTGATACSLGEGKAGIPACKRS